MWRDIENTLTSTTCWNAQLNRHAIHIYKNCAIGNGNSLYLKWIEKHHLI